MTARGGIGRRLASESAVYGFGGIANQALTVILVPIYATQLGTSGMGVVAIITATLSFAQLLATLALPQAFFRAYLGRSEAGDERRSVLAGSLGLRVAVSIGFVAVYSLAAFPLTLALFADAADLPLLLLIGPIVFFDSLNLVPLSFLRAERRAKAYAAISFGRAILGSVLIIVLVVFLDMGPLGVVVGSLGSALVTAGVGMAVLVRRTSVRPRWDPVLARSMLAFSLPLVPASLASWGLNLSDRYVLTAFRSLDEVGVYAIGYTAGLVINALAIAPFSLAWGAAYWEIARQDAAPAVISRVLTTFTVAAAGVALALSAIGTDAIRLLLDDSFADARYIVPFSAFSMVLYGVYTIVTTGLNLTSHTGWLPIAMGLAAAVNLALNLTLIPPLGMIGAGIATVAGYGLLAVSSGLASQRYYPVPWDLYRVGGSLLIGAVLAAAAILGPDSILWRLASIGAFVLLVVALRIVRGEDLGRVRRILTRRGS